MFGQTLRQPRTSCKNRKGGASRAPRSRPATTAAITHGGALRARPRRGPLHTSEGGPRIAKKPGSTGHIGHSATRLTSGDSDRGGPSVSRSIRRGGTVADGQGTRRHSSTGTGYQG